MTTRTSYMARASLILSVAASPSLHAATTPLHRLEIVNRVPRFQVFYTAATKAPLTKKARWTLWKKDDGIAAVPPGKAGDAMARKLLDSAWGRYSALEPGLPVLTRNAEATARALFAADNALLQTQSDRIDARLVLYVGQFDGNAFTIPPQGGKPATVVMPVENTNLRIALAHELTHAIHMQLAHVQNSFGAPIGETMFLEGLAMHTAQRAVPGLPDAAYVEMPGDEGWMRRCVEKKAAILAGIAADLDKSGPAIAMKYTFGDGNTGLRREAYCAAWFVVGRMLRSGKSLPTLARIPEDRMVAAIRAALESR